MYFSQALFAHLNHTHSSQDRCETEAFHTEMDPQNGSMKKKLQQLTSCEFILPAICRLGPFEMAFADRIGSIDVELGPYHTQGENMTDRLSASELALAKLDGRSMEVVKTHRSVKHRHCHNNDGTTSHPRCSSAPLILIASTGWCIACCCSLPPPPPPPKDKPQCPPPTRSAQVGT